MKIIRTIEDVRLCPVGTVLETPAEELTVGRLTVPFDKDVVQKVDPGEWYYLGDPVFRRDYEVARRLPAKVLRWGNGEDRP